jgi:GNAT superfamily N-acetyltransferase
MSTEVLFRRATVPEKRQLEALQLRASLQNPGDREALLAHPDAIEIPEDQLEASLVVVAEVADTVVGFAVILPRDDGDCDLDALFVEPDLWRRGYGRMLVDYCAAAAVRRGAAALHVVGNPHAERFYGACGFQTLGITQTRFGPGLLMRRQL